MLAVTTGVKWPTKSSSSLSAEGENWHWPKEWAFPFPGPDCPFEDGPSDEEEEDDEEEDDEAIGIKAIPLLGDLACKSAAATLAPACPGNSTRW